MASLEEFKARAGQTPQVPPPRPTLEDLKARSQILQTLSGPAPLPQPLRSEEEAPGIGQRMVRRLMGTNVDDPMPLTRAGTTALGSIGGAVAGSRTPVAPGLAGFFINPVTGTLVGGAGGAITGAVALP